MIDDSLDNRKAEALATIAKYSVEDQDAASRIASLYDKAPQDSVKHLCDVACILTSQFHQTMQMTTHNHGHFVQITISSGPHERKALLTRRKGSRTWAVRGRLHDSDMRYDVPVADKVSKAKAMQAAEWFVKHG